MTKTLRFLSALALVGSLAACDSLLDTNPPDKLPDDVVFTTADGARKALIGAYNALEDDSYYGGDFLLMGDLGSDDALHIGIYNQYADADAHTLRADNSFNEGVWAAIYVGIQRANILIARVPGVPGLDPAERDQILGEAYFLRGLHYFNLVRYYGGVPLRTEPAEDMAQAAQLTRATVAETYAQIVSDLQQAETLMSNTTPTTQGTPGAAKAILAKVYLTQGDYANALAKANEVAGLGYSLASTFSDLFPDDEGDTPEDIFKVSFTDVLYQYMYYWIDCGDGGGCELAPTQSVIDDYTDPFYPADADVRLAWSISGTTEPDAWGTKYPTTAGAEDVPAIRFADVLLIRAEANAQLGGAGNLSDAVDDINLIRGRAGLTTLTLGNEITTQQEVLDEVLHQRRLELFAEGDRWFTLVRTGKAVTDLGVPVNQTLYPIPQSEMDAMPNLEQNPGY
jgi:hypothetical protein